MATVREISDPYLNYLVPVLPRGDGVCETCWSFTESPGPFCRLCASHRAVLGPRVSDVVVPIALAPVGGQFAHELWHYKNSPRQRVRARFTVQFAALLWRFLSKHEKCVAQACRVSSFSIVTSVPGTSRRIGPHPLGDILCRRVGLTRPRFDEVLVLRQGVVTDRQLRPDRYQATRRIDGESILLVDDIWTTGAHVQSAVDVLRDAGAAKIGTVVIGRHFDSTYQDHDAYLRRARRQPFSWDLCCLERSVPGSA